MNSLCHRYLNQNILPFVGREGELRGLRNVFREFLEEGESKYALVSGESGSGKSRLVREFEEYLGKEFGESCVIVHARYLEGNAAALTPIINAFNATLAQQDNLKQFLHSTNPRSTMRSDLGDLAIGPSGLENADSGAPPLQLLLDSMNEIAKRFPLVIILEDVHNLEDIPLFDQFFLGLGSVSKFVILTERTGVSKRSHTGSFEHLIREIALREERSSELIPLADFTSENLRKLFHLLFEIDASDELIESVKSRTSGRPLSLRTMLRQLVTTGVLQYDHGVWSEDRTAEFEEIVPDTGEQETLARFQRELERLNEYEQLVAMHGSLLGEQFDVRLLRHLISQRLGERDLTEEMFQRAIDLLTFKSIIRKATPSIYLSADPPLDAAGREKVNAWCYEFSHQHFWNTVLESARTAVVSEPELVTTIVWLAGHEHLPLYSSAFLSVANSPVILTKNAHTSEQIEYFLQWASSVVRSLWSQEPQQSLRLLLGLRPIRDEVTWRFGPDLSESAMAALLDLHSLLVEAFMRTGAALEAERDLEHGAVLEKFIQGSRIYSASFKGISKGRIATLRAILYESKTNYQEFERWSEEARKALTVVPEDDLERARLLTLIARTKANVLLNFCKFKEADALIEQSMKVAQMLADTRFDEYSMFFRAAVTSKLRQDQNAQATELTQHIITLAQQRGNTLAETTFLVQAALAAFSTGDIPAATNACDMGILNGRRYGIRFVEIMSYLWRMIIAGVMQDIEKVKECSQQLSTLVEDARVVAQAPNVLQRITLIEGRATAMNFLGRYHAALEFAEEAIQLAGSHQHDSFAAWAQNEKALALIGLGQFEDALSVATACVNLAGEQKRAERTARTALIMAFAGLGRFEDAKREVEKVRAEYNEKNPYYLQFLLAESRLLRLTIGSARDHAERMRLRQRLATNIEEMLVLATSWDASVLHEQIRKEFEDIASKKIEGDPLAAIIKKNSIAAAEERPKAIIRLRTFGNLTAEPIDPDMLTSDSEEKLAEDTTPAARPKERETKVRQLVSLLATLRAEASEGRSSSRVVDRSAISKETLIDMLWADSDSSNVANVLHTTVKRARAFLGNPAAIVLTDDGYSLSPIVEADCDEVLRHYAESRQARKRNALFSVTFHYDQILKLSDRGVFMEGIYGPWLEGLRTRLTTVRRTAAIRLIQTELERGLLDRVEDLCHKLLAQDEFDEEALRGLLIVSARRRQPARLVRLFDDYSEKLRKEFRTDPSAELRSLYTKLTSATAVED